MKVRVWHYAESHMIGRTACGEHPRLLSTTTEKSGTTCPLCRVVLGMTAEVPR